jgi:hypothetical protein
MLVKKLKKIFVVLSVMTSLCTATNVHANCLDFYNSNEGLNGIEITAIGTGAILIGAYGAFGTQEKDGTLHEPGSKDVRQHQIGALVVTALTVGAFEGIKAIRQKVIKSGGLGSRKTANDLLAWSEGYLDYESAFKYIDQPNTYPQFKPDLNRESEIDLAYAKMINDTCGTNISKDLIQRHILSLSNGYNLCNSRNRTYKLEKFLTLVCNQFPVRD